MDHTSLKELMALFGYGFKTSKTGPDYSVPVAPIGITHVWLSKKKPA